MKKDQHQPLLQIVSGEQNGEGCRLAVDLTLRHAANRVFRQKFITLSTDLETRFFRSLFCLRSIPLFGFLASTIDVASAENVLNDGGRRPEVCRQAGGEAGPAIPLF